MGENKRKIVITIGVVIVLVAIVLTAAYAYFTSQIGEAAQTNVNVTAETTDSLQFKTGGAISIYANQENFTEGKGNRSDSTTATATLIAGTNRTANYDYYLYLNIDTNDFEYTTDAKTPELVLKVTLEDQPYKNVSGLTYNDAIGGYDITEVDGLITIANKYNITTTTTETDNWKIEIILVNLDSNQNANTGKTFTGEVSIQKDEMKYSDICNDSTLACSVVKTFESDNSLYYHGSNLANGAEDKSYRYSGSNNIVKNYVCFGTVDKYTCLNDTEKYMYRIIGVFNESIIDEEGNDTGEKEHRVKLIKDDFVNSDILGTDGDYSTGTYLKVDYANYIGNYDTINIYYWNKTNSYLANKETGYNNVWSYSELNKTNLNKNYISYLKKINTKWTNMIATTKWSVGGAAFSKIITAKQYYDRELNYKTSYISKIGLMYVNEYGYAISSENWTTALNDYNNEIVNNNWMYTGLNEWTISRDSSYSGYAIYVNNGGDVSRVGISAAGGVRPSFYLSSNVKLKSGTGSIDDPYIISL